MPSEPMKKLLDAMAGPAKFMQTRSQALFTYTCVQCGKPATHFDDAPSQAEWYISALCQACQTELFGTTDQD